MKLLARFLALAALLAAAQLASAQEPERSALERRHLAEVSMRYADALWPRGAARSGLALDLELPGYVPGELQSSAGRVTHTFRRAGATAESDPSFVLESRVADSVAEAHAVLVEWLAGLQSPARMPALADVGLELGDVGFAGRSGAAPDALAWIAFVRGNVAVRLSAFDAPREPGLDLGAPGAVIDAAIRSAPRLAAGSAPPKPRVTAASFARASAVAGEAVPLSLVVEDPLQGEPHLEWVVGGPGQGYVERDALGEWVLHTTAPGAITLALEVTASNGTWTRHELALNVLDD